MPNPIKKLVHIFGQTPHHYVPMKSFFDKVGEGADYEQEYWVWQPESGETQDGFYPYPKGKALLQRMHKEPPTTRFVFHGLFDRSIWPQLAISSLLKRSVWVCWGAEVYQYRVPGVTLKKRIAYFFLQVMGRRFSSIFALTKGDAELIESMLSAKHVKVLPYPLIGVDAAKSEKSPNQPAKVLVGNSASEANNHLQALSWLEHFREQDLEIIVPLNYAGPTDYIKEVVARGLELFGDKFKPITQMLSKAEYDRLLANIDIAIFAHERQQGLYVVYSMFKTGGKMYLKPSTTSFQMLRDNGFEVFASDQIHQLGWDDFVCQDSATAKKNKLLMQVTYSEEALTPKWRSSLTELGN